MILRQCFHENHMTMNSGKCHYIVVAIKNLLHPIMRYNNEIASSNEEKLLGILLDSKLKFEIHVDSFCRKAKKLRKINTLSRLKN